MKSSRNGSDNRMKRSSIYLVIAISALLFLSGFVAINQNSHYFKSFKHSEMIRKIHLEQEAAAVKVEELFFTLRLLTSNLIAQNMLGRHLNNARKNEIREYLGQIKSSLKEVLAIYLLDRTGTCVVSTDRRFEGKNYGFRPYFQQALRLGKGVYVARGVTSGQLGLYLAGRVNKKKSGTLGVLVMKIDPLSLWRKEKAIPSIGFEKWLVTPSGILFNSRNKGYYLLGPIGKRVEQVLRASRQFEGIKLQTLGFEEETWKSLLSRHQLTLKKDGKRYLLSYYPLFPNALGMLVILSEDFKTPALVMLNRSMKFMDLAFILALFPIIILSFYLEKQFDRLKKYKKIVDEHAKRILLFETAIQKSTSHILITDSEGRIEYVNPTFLKRTGYTEQEVLGQTPRILKSGHQDEAFYREMWQKIQSGKVWQGRFLNKRKGGSLYWEDAVISPVIDEQGHITHFVAIKYEITDLVQLEEALQQRIAELETVMRHANVGIALIKGWKFMKVNKTLSQIAGKTEEEMIGQKIHPYFSFVDAFQRHLSETSRTGGRPRPFIFEYKKTSPDGQHKWFHILANAVDGGTEDEREIVLVVQDITDIRELQEKLAREKERAEAANRAKSEFLMNMSHEIRTPLNGVIGMLSLLHSTRLDETQAQYLEGARTSAEALLFLLNDILDLSKIEAGKLEFEEIDFDLRDLILGFVTSMKVVATKKGLEMGVTIDPNLPTCLKGDPGRLRQIIYNLTGNALKFTEKGSIHIKATLERMLGEEAIVKISVKDTGIGIPRDKMDRLFKKFSQADSSVASRFGGTGLGLAISKNLASMMGGEIGVQSEVGKGSTFWFTIRLKRGAPTAEGCRKSTGQSGSGRHITPISVSIPELQGKRILVVEDNEINRQVALGILGRLGLKAETACNGEEAITALSQAPYDLVLMDVQMPVMDGVTATRKIRSFQSKALNPKIPIIALSAHAIKSEVERCLGAGMDGYLTKPIIIEDLLSVLRKWLGYEDAGSNLPHSAPPVKEAEPPDLPPKFDLKSLLSRTMGDRAFAKKVVEIFLQTAPETMDALGKAIQDPHTETIARLAHTLKGSAANIGGMAVSEIAKGINQSADRGDLASLSEQYEKLHREFEALREKICQEFQVAGCP